MEVRPYILNPMLQLQTELRENCPSPLEKIVYEENKREKLEKSFIYIFIKRVKDLFKITCECTRIIKESLILTQVLYLLNSRHL